MCGLVGIVSSRPIPGLESIIARMNDSQHHRGPDQTGLFAHPSEKFALAHKRLSIIDVTHGRQPMTDADGRYTLVFNGEIYNHQSLKDELKAKGHPIATRSDTETLLYAFKEWGTGCLSRLRGMFAFAVYDHREGCVYLARDRLGIKPMYYGFSGGAALFASECKAILAFPGFDRSLDPQAMSDFFSFMYVPAPKSIYKGIRKLPAGHWVKLVPGQDAQPKEYWDLEFSARGEYRSEKDLGRGIEDLLGALDEAVASHMESDVPLGAFLSGGVDSAAVVALMAKRSARKVITNTIGFSHRAYDESAQARSTAEHFGTDHHDFTVEPDAAAILDKLSWYYDEPFADPSMIPTYYVCEMARKTVTVALSGDGGDENFAGYRRHYFDSLENRIRGLLPAGLRQSAFGFLGAIYPKADRLPRMFRAKTLLRNLSYPPVKAYFTSLTHIHPDMKAGLFGGDLKRQLAGYDSLSVFEAHWRKCAGWDPLSRIQYLDFKTYLVDDILTKVDRASMANSLEVRVPILDHKVVELAASMPPGWKLRGKTGKFVFKEALRPVLPAEIFSRPKSGFSVPIEPWLRKELSGYASDLLFGKDGVASSGMFEKAYVERIWKEHQSGARNRSWPIFALLSFSIWHRRFIQNPV
jgi:asparagine synthase (glutamine-hydrolysing)